VALPPAPVQASVKVVVPVNPPRASEPFSGRVPLQPPLAVQAFALAVVQLSEVEPPLVTVVGVAVNVIVGAAGGVTVTLTDCVAAPPAPVQVSVKVELAVSPLRGSEPLTTLVPLQPPLAVQLVAFDELQVSVADPPRVTVVGAAVSVTDGAVADVTVTFADWVAEPPGPVQVSANEEFEVSAPVEAEPEIGLLPVQLPAAVQAVALEEDHVSVADEPDATVDGTAVSVTNGGCGPPGGATPAITVLAAVPPAPLHVSI
jgi:hypothetical protein